MAGDYEGLPCTIRDTSETEGVRTTAIPLLTDEVSRQDALAVARTRAGGMAMFGMISVPLTAGNWQSRNDICGCSDNLWDLTHPRCGLSGGGAAAAAPFRHSNAR
jgi:amidase